MSSSTISITTIQFGFSSLQIVKERIEDIANEKAVITLSRTALRTIKWTAYTKKTLVADMNVDFRRFRIHMPQQSLNVFNINTVFKKMAGKAVTTAMT